jgi:hypothetical protein
MKIRLRKSREKNSMTWITLPEMPILKRHRRPVSTRTTVTATNSISTELQISTYTRRLSGILIDQWQEVPVRAM